MSRVRPSCRAYIYTGTGGLLCAALAAVLTVCFGLAIPQKAIMMRLPSMLTRYALLGVGSRELIDLVRTLPDQGRKYDVRSPLQLDVWAHSRSTYDAPYGVLSTPPGPTAPMCILTACA